MRAAVIDLGTNTFHLIIAELSPAGIAVIYKTNVPVRLGEGRINEHLIIPQAFERGIATLRNFRAEIDKYEVEVVRALATSAVRSAANGQEFVAEAARSAGISIDVITGAAEAELIFRGVKASGAIQQESLIMDIGGGSTEFIICSPEGLQWKHSYDIGAARLLQAFFHSDPVSAEDQQAIRKKLDDELQELKTVCQHFKPRTLIGSAGAFETFAAMLLPGIAIKDIRSADLDVKDYQHCASRLICSTHKEREEMPDLIPLRVDMIVVASLMTSYIIDQLEITAMKVSTYDLKMGALNQIWEDQKSDNA